MGYVHRTVATGAKRRHGSKLAPGIRISRSSALVDEG
jgi:hypothetical protein